MREEERKWQEIHTIAWLTDKNNYDRQNLTKLITEIVLREFIKIWDPECEHYKTKVNYKKSNRIFLTRVNTVNK